MSPVIQGFFDRQWLHSCSESELLIEKSFLLNRSIFCALALALIFSGCEKSPPAVFRFNEVEWKKQERLQLSEDETFPSEYRTQIGNLMTALFGTPDDPRFPLALGEPGDPLVSMENLQMAAGPVKSGREGEPAGLYREHCAHCHGISGDGAGPTAGFLNPYPRDFRLGKFKFKSTPLRQAPTDEDMVNLLRNGIPGTAMPSFRTLDPKEMSALIDYVKYLTIRGQFERRLIAEIGNLDGEPLLSTDWVAQEKAILENENEDDDEDFADQRQEFEDMLYDTVSGFLNDEGILDRWYSADDNITEVPDAPDSFQLTHNNHAELVSQGKQLFAGKANCVQCHGESGLGDGQTENFDDWFNDWIKTSGVDPYVPDTYTEFVKAGAFAPRPIRPRNLLMPIFRGGNQPDDIYRRIANGIEGTPMPSSPTLNSDEIWALVAYVKALAYDKTGQPDDKPVNERAVR